MARSPAIWPRPKSMKALKDLWRRSASPTSTAARTARSSAAARAQSYLFNSTIAGIEDADAILLVGANPRWEAPVLNARIRKAWLAAASKVAIIGPRRRSDLSGAAAGHRRRGAGTDRQWQPSDFAKVLNDAKRPMIILGAGALARADGAAVLQLAAQDRRRHRHDRSRGQRMPKAAGTASTCCTPPPARVAALDLGFLPGAGGRDVAGIVDGAQKGEIDLLFLLGADEIDVAASGPRLRHLSGHPWRRRRAPRRRDPAGRGLYRERTAST